MGRRLISHAFNVTLLSCAVGFAASCGGGSGGGSAGTGGRDGDAGAIGGAMGGNTGGGGDGGSAGGRAGATLAQFLDQYLDASCALEARCGDFPDAMTCRASKSFNRDQIIADVQAGRRAYAAGQAAGCLDALVVATCNVSDQRATTACAGAVTGNVANRGRCTADAQCTSGACDRTNCGVTSCCAGSCTAALPIGSDCAQPNSVCAGGAVCTLDSVSGLTTCAARIAAGQPCGTYDVCAAGALCVGGTCTKLPAEGEACGTLCDSSADFCDQAAGRCVPRLPVGAACAHGRCALDAVCDQTSLTCVFMAGPGSPCGSVSCLGDLVCMQNGCSLPPTPTVCI